MPRRPDPDPPDATAADRLPAGRAARSSTVPADAPAGAAFERLVALMRTLRGDGGCAWDRQQTLASLRPFVIEEAYEVVDAIDRGDPDALCDELGDFLLEAVFLAQISAERGDFDIADALGAVCDKLVRRHPHIFGRGGGSDGDRAGGGAAMSAAEVKRQWEAIKADERRAAGRTQGALGEIPASLPALLHADRVGKRAAAVGFDWPDAHGADAKVTEELAELAAARAAGSTAEVTEEIGDLLFAVANLARHLGVDPESALRAATRKFTRRFRAMEAQLRDRGLALRDAAADDLDAAWRRIKADD